MDGLTFWSTMGQVAATFVGLSFVGMSIYLSGIRTAISLAISEVNPNLRHDCKSERFIYTAVSTNLTLFVLPLILSFYMISEHTQPGNMNYVIVLLMVNFMIIIFNLRMFRHKRIKDELSFLKRINRILFLKARILTGELIVPLISLTFFLLIILNIYYESFWSYTTLKAISLSSLFLGLIIGIYDLFVFDSKNICFELSEDSRNELDIMYREVDTKFNDLVKQYNGFIKTLKDREKVEKMAKDHNHTKSDIDAYFAYKDGIEKNYTVLEKRKASFCEKGELLNASTLSELTEHSYIKRDIVNKIDFLNEEIKAQLKELTWIGN